MRGRLTITTGTDGQGEHSASCGPDEGELLGRLRTGDEDAFACLVDRHHAAMVRFARGYVRSPAVAEEVAQDAWLGLLRGLDRFEGRSSLRTWLFRIVANRAISTGLHERQHLPVDDSELGDEGGRFSQDGWWVTPPVHWADEAVDRMVAPELAAPRAGGGVVTTRDAKPEAHDITCQQAVGLMTDYLDGALGPDDRALVEAHLGECEGCAEHLRQIRITVAVTGRIREEDLAPAAREDLMGTLPPLAARPGNLKGALMPHDVRIESYGGPRDSLRPLFELADDSAIELDSYIKAGRVLVATSDGEVIGHLQLTGTGDPRQVEIKNMAVRETWQGQGIGRRLIQAAINLVAAEGVRLILVATAAADIGNLRFYQRQGFRMRSVERDAFTPATGYPPGLLIDGIELRDRVWLDRAVHAE